MTQTRERERQAKQQITIFASLFSARIRADL